MKTINVEQGSQEWLKWRKEVITATECSAIMGSNPWETPYTIWGMKLGIIPPKASNKVMEEGKRLEPFAREDFIKKFKINMTPICVESTEFEFLGASLDGISDDGIDILEIKCGEKVHSLAKQGIIPPYYLHQVQQQLLVSGARKCFYYSYDGVEGICIEVYPDFNFKNEYLPKAREFWRCIAFEEAPPLQDKDYKNMSEDWEWLSCSESYQEADALIKQMEEKKESYRKKLIELCKDQNCSGNGVKVMRMKVKGRIPYADIEEIKAMDLEKHRKPSTTCWKILTK